MHDHLLRSSRWLDADDPWVGEAAAVGVPDLEAFETCLEDPQTRTRLRADSTIAAAFGITATPSFLSRGGVHSGSATIDELVGLTRR